MTQISLTSGEIMDIVSILCSKEQAVYDKDPLLSAYYLRMVQQFEDVYHKLQELPGEKRVANLILAAWIMIIIYRADQWELISAPQDIEKAWELADKLSQETGVQHNVGRV